MFSSFDPLTCDTLCDTVICVLTHPAAAAMAAAARATREREGVACGLRCFLACGSVCATARARARRVCASLLDVYTHSDCRATQAGLSLSTTGTGLSLSAAARDPFYSPPRSRSAPRTATQATLRRARVPICARRGSVAVAAIASAPHLGCGATEVAAERPALPLARSPPAQEQPRSRRRAARRASAALGEARRAMVGAPAARRRGSLR